MQIRAAIPPALFVWALQLSAAAQTPPRAAFTVTLNGDTFTNKTLTLTPARVTYANNILRSSRDPRATRIELNSYDNPGAVELQIGVPPVLGRYVFDQTDEDKPDRNPYLHFYFKMENPKDGSQVWFYKPVHVEVVITKLDPVGGRIEGTVHGTIAGGGPGVVTVDGRFSVVRVKDKVVD